MRKVWRYHAEHPARVFEGDEAIENAEAEGWVDSPAKVEPITKGDGDANQDADMDGGDANTPPPETMTEEETALGFKIPENLKDLSVKKLKKLCKHRGLTGYSNLNEADLIALLEG
jgi:hypothetical protein